MDTRILLSVLVLGASLTAAELIRSASPAVGAVLLVILGAVVAAVASAPSPASIGMGAMAALAYGALRPQAPIAAWAVFALLVLFARGLRARGTAAWLTHGALSLLGGACAAWLSLGYTSADLAARGASVVVAGLMLALPLVIPVDDPQTAGLLELARRSRGPSRARLLRAAALSRRAARSDDVSRADRRLLAGVFSAMQRAAMRAERRSSRELDGALTDQLTAIGRFLRAIDARSDATVGLETRGDTSLALAREAVESEAKALRDLT